MTKSTVRGYVVALSLLGFSAAWTAASHNPFQQRQATRAGAGATDPRIAALDASAAQLRRQAAEVRRIIAGRQFNGALPAGVSVVSAPPVTQTSTS